MVTNQKRKKEEGEVSRIANLLQLGLSRHTPFYLMAALTMLILQCSIGIGPAWAGPPFLTDDPETVEYKHWEVYIASQYANDKDGYSGTAPHFEVNYGVWPNVQLHMIVPLAYEHPKGEATTYGIGDMELGVKYRFLQESGWVPMAGVFPLLEIPTGDESRNLGSGEVMAFLPLWLQKSWGPWTTYGGGGYWINPGSGNKDYWFVGWEGQREVTKHLTIGAEVFHMTPSAVDEGDQTGFNVGALIHFSENYHLLFSAGRDFDGPNRFSMYIGFLWTFGPPGEPTKERKDVSEASSLFPAVASRR